jgi:predicted Zn-dependent protease
MMYMASASTDSANYAQLINEFIQKFPSAPDGYAYRAQFATSYGDFTAAEKDMEEAIKLSANKDNEHYNYARLIYNKEIYQANMPYANWSLDKALSEAREAWKLNPIPAYRELEANILYAQKNYDEAYNRYIELTKTNMVTADTWYCAAQCKGQLKDTTAMIALLDSAMNMFSKPYLKQAAPYLWARANAKFESKKYREAVTDMNDYEQLMAADVNANFYYIRHQAEIEGRLFQQALNDITQATKMEPKNTFYLAEKASLELRVGLYDQAAETANEIKALEPDNSDGYLFLGLSQCMKGNKKDGLTNLQKAKELGYPQADELIEKYAK